MYARMTNKWMFMEICEKSYFVTKKNVQHVESFVTDGFCVYVCRVARTKINSLCEVMVCLQNQNSYIWW